MLLAEGDWYVAPVVATAFVAIPAALSKESAIEFDHCRELGICLPHIPMFAAAQTYCEKRDTLTVFDTLDHDSVLNRIGLHGFISVGGYRHALIGYNELSTELAFRASFPVAPANSTNCSVEIHDRFP
jgi:hypothetical protein